MQSQSLFPNGYPSWDAPVQHQQQPQTPSIASPTLPRYGESPAGNVRQRGPAAPHHVHQQQQPQTPYATPGGARGGVGGPLFEDFGTQEFFNQVTDNPIAQMGLSYGTQWAAGAGERYKQGITKYLEATNLKYYFNINNSYVPNKLKVILCPFLHPSMQRQVELRNEVHVHLSPKEDINAPDLYIPIMAFVTYILTIAFYMGTMNAFKPELLGKLASSGLIAISFEVLFVRFGFYLLGSSVAILDLVAYCGYIFVGCVVNQFVAILLGPFFYYIITAITGTFMGIFMVRTLRLVVLPDNSVANSPLPHNKRNYFLLSVALLQVVMAYFLGFYSI
eukprot:TRINITY_DN1571_c0_g1_i1.p1 TRINITY_DN1571_c0_g1~~TRINITY_DN1571_c0_g1_i1.p1  ORF type:complete len:334 (+),score=45.75 TRINITY_DN1571_c0_g1_i1:81-1082(+)